MFRRNKQLLLHLLIIAFFATISMSSSFYQGLTGGNDLTQHYQFALSIHQSITSGEIYPGYIPSVNYGFGDYGLRFYPPFSYYVVSLVYLLVNDWYVASLFSFFLVFWLSGIGTYLWSKEEFSPPQALIAAALYTFAPYHLNQIYNNFLFAEFFSTAIVPFCFLFVTRVCRKSGYLNVLGLSISFALLILTNLPQSIICSLSLGIYGLVLLRKETFFSVFPKLLLSVISGLILSSFYWVRMVTEMSWIKHSLPQYFSDTLAYDNNFLLRVQNILNFRDDVLNLWLAELMLWAILLVSLPTIYFIFKNKAVFSRFLLAVTVVFATAVILTSPLSRVIWDNFELLQKVQFPWRWVGLASLFGSVFASAGIFAANEKLKKENTPGLTIGLGIVLVFYVFTASFIVKGAVYYPRQTFNNQIEGKLNNESFDCWWTIWANRSGWSQTEKVSVNNRKVTIKDWTTYKQSFTIENGVVETATVKLFYYPHWKAIINGEQIETQPNKSGLISFSVPASAGEVLLEFREPLFVRLSYYLSFAGWIMALAMIGFLLFTSSNTRRQTV